MDMVLIKNRVYEVGFTISLSFAWSLQSITVLGWLPILWRVDFKEPCTTGAEIVWRRGLKSD